MASKSLATECINDILTKIKTVALIKDNKTFYVYSEEDLLDESKGRQMPCVGVMWGGLRTVTDGSGKGLSAMCRVILVVVADSKAAARLDRKESVVELLDAMRDVIKGTRAPTQHFWQFAGEAPYPMQGSRLLYLQTWQVPTILS